MTAKTKYQADLNARALDAHLAMVVSVECPCKQCDHGNTSTGDGCPNCSGLCSAQADGTGHRWLLRVECPCVRYLNAREHDALGPYPCSACHGNHSDVWEICDGKPVFGGSVWEAIRALGWAYSLTSWTNGDSVQIYGVMPDHDYSKPIGSVNVDEGLRDERAVKVALARAWEAV